MEYNPFESVQRTEMWKTFWNTVFQKSLEHNYELEKYKEFVLEWCSMNDVTKSV